MTRYQDTLPKDALFVKVTRTIARPVAETFAYIVPVDLTDKRTKEESTMNQDAVTTADTLQQNYDSYLAAYSDIAPTERERLLRQSVTNDVMSINPEGESHGIVDLMKHIEQFQKQKPGTRFKSNKLIAHHDQFLSEWTMYSKNGSALAIAHTYGRFNEKGLITYLIGFFEQPQK
jgi:hypothetical protein